MLEPSELAVTCLVCRTILHSTCSSSSGPDTRVCVEREVNLLCLPRAERTLNGQNVKQLAGGRLCTLAAGLYAAISTTCKS